MAYGIQVFNSAGRTVFNTDEQYPNFYVSSNVNSTAYNYDPGSVATDQILCARPNNGESGTIALRRSDNRFIGGTTSTQLQEVNFSAAEGVRVIKLDRDDDLTAAGSGYGVEVYKSNGTDLLFTSNVSYKIDVLTFGQLGSTADITYDVPSGVPFDEVFVSLGSANFTYTYSPSSPFGSVRSIYGSWVYFDNANSQLRIRKGLIVTIGATPDWDYTLGGYSGSSVNSYIVYRITTTAT
jgi:hypothetical protein